MTAFRNDEGRGWKGAAQKENQRTQNKNENYSLKVRLYFPLLSLKPDTVAQLRIVNVYPFHHKNKPPGLLYSLIHPTLSWLLGM